MKEYFLIFQQNLKFFRYAADTSYFFFLILTHHLFLECAYFKIIKKCNDPNTFMRVFRQNFYYYDFNHFCFFIIDGYIF